MNIGQSSPERLNIKLLSPTDRTDWYFPTLSRDLCKLKILRKLNDYCKSDFISRFK